MVGVARCLRGNRDGTLLLHVFSWRFAAVSTASRQLYGCSVSVLVIESVIPHMQTRGRGGGWGRTGGDCVDWEGPWKDPRTTQRFSTSNLLNFRRRVRIFHHVVSSYLKTLRGLPPGPLRRSPTSRAPSPIWSAWRPGRSGGIGLRRLSATSGRRSPHPRCPGSA